MSILNSFKRAFGFSDEDSLTDEKEFEDNNTSTTPLVENEPMQQLNTVSLPLQDPDNKDLIADIFDCIVQLFNSTQPEFVKQCLDTDAQKSFILNQLSDSLKSALQKETDRARQKGQMLWQKERTMLGNEVEELKRQKSQLEHKREESKSEKLSAERQKRALTERVHDLENQILDLQAEKEQYQLENRSMLNKLRVASITGGDEKAALEIEALTARQNVLVATIADILEKTDSIAAAATDATAAKTRIEELNLSIAQKDSRIEFLKKMQTEDADRITSLTRHADSLAAKVASLTNEVETLNATIAKNLADSAAAIEKASAAASQQKQKKQRKKPKPHISAIDELIDSTDWFVSSSPEELIEEKPIHEEDFGYTEPKQKPLPDDDKQLLLW